MPAAIAVPAIASVVGAGAQAYGQHKATKASERSTNAALAFEREREAARRAEYDKAMAAYEKRMAAYEQNRNALLGRYGVSVAAPISPGMPVRGASTPLPSAPGAPGAGAPGIQSGGFMPGVADRVRAVAGPQSIGQMIAPEELSAWNSWERRGLA